MSTVKSVKTIMGTDDFKRMVTEYDIFVDKTLLIKEIIESDETAILITCPRRWGKSLNLDMLRTFFAPEWGECQEKWSYQQQERSCNVTFKNQFWRWWSRSHYESLKNKLCSRDIFTGGHFFVSGEERNLNPLLIAEVDNGKYMQHQGKYPVIFISLKDVVAYTLDELESKLKSIIKFLYMDHSYLANSDKLDEYDKIDFKKYISQEYNGIMLTNGVKFLSELLHKHHGSRVYIFVDEYDKPINMLLEKYLGEYLGEERGQDFLDFIKKAAMDVSYTFCSSVGKGNEHLEKLILSGMFDTTQKEAGSGCNNVAVFGITDPRLSRYYGFSEDETRDIIEKFNFQNKSNILVNAKDWYSGYTVPISQGKTMNLYSPWSVMNYLHNAYIQGEDFQPRSSFSKSGGATLIRKLFKKEKCLDSQLSKKLISFSNNQTYDLKFDHQTSLLQYDWLTSSYDEKFFSYILTSTGYLTVEKSNDTHIFRVPNRELLQEFENLIPYFNKECKPGIIKNYNYLKAIKMIQQKDLSGIKAALLQGTIQCHNEEINLNLFHITAIFGNAEIFDFLLRSKCNLFKDFSDNLHELLPKDYAFLVKNNEIIRAIDNYTDSTGKKLAIEVPSGFVGGIACPLYSTTWISLIVSATVLGGVMPLLGQGSKYVTDRYGITWKSLGGVVGVSILLQYLISSGKWGLESMCENYQTYQDIDISKPGRFTSLMQFEKYLLKHPNAQVVLDNSCPNLEEPLHSLPYGIFKGSSLGHDEFLEFTLCAGASDESAYGNSLSDQL